MPQETQKINDLLFIKTKHLQCRRILDKKIKRLNMKIALTRYEQDEAEVEAFEAEVNKRDNAIERART